MTPQGIKDILQQGEGIEVEFKESLFELNKSTFESICAFLNRKGGYLLLGVANDGSGRRGAGRESANADRCHC
ncbi:ATP-binding protein [Flavisolibacter tropicus]|uniref:AlbA family DNA-binding domain-containing protein n=1 Tax=Flavisolibacter tropicus TaxID=1492898 RepID=UPI0009EEC2EA